MVDLLRSIQSRFNAKFDVWGNNDFSGSDAACFAWIFYWLGSCVTRYWLTGAVFEGAGISFIAIIVGLVVLFSSAKNDRADHE